MAREMIHSGIEWIGEIPKEWKVARFKFVSEMFTGNSLNEHQKEYYSQYHDNESSIPYVSTKDVERDIERINYDGEIRIPESEQGFSIAPKYSVLLCIEGGSAGKKVGYTNQKVCFVNKLCCINSNQNSRFIYFFILSNAFNEPFAQNIQGLIGGVSVNSLKNFYITTPPLSEQQKIANYLDKVCGEVDEMIALQEQMIEELKAYKQSVITEAVTKGLNPNTPMKDSGIDWIGEVPEYWEIGRIGLFFFVTKLAGFEYTDTLMNTISPDGCIPIVRAQNVRMFKFNKEGISEFTDMGTSLLLNRCSLNQKALLLTFIGAGIGDVCLFNETQRFHLAPNVAKLELNEAYKSNIQEEYVMYYLGSDAGKGEINKISKASAQASLSMSTIRKISFTLPPISEQQSIASYLDTKCAEIDALIAIKQAKIEELKEYKKSVIYEYVTGKKEVV